MKERTAAGMPSIRTTEVAVALALMALGAVVMWDSARVGSGWASDGPGAGYFPFYIGLLVVLGSVINLIRALRADGAAARRLLFDRAQLRSILSVLLPAMVFVAAIPFSGIYVAAALYIGFFMRWLGRFSWPTVFAVGLGVPIVAFLTFEIWFLVALPKGPLEDWLGF